MASSKAVKLYYWWRDREGFGISPEGSAGEQPFDQADDTFDTADGTFDGEET
jgi:hypothetical protein